MSQLHKIFRVEEDLLQSVNTDMEERFGVSGVLENLEQEANSMLDDRLSRMGLSRDSKPQEVYEGLFGEIENYEKQLYENVGVSPDNFDFHKIADKAKGITGERKGFFLKKEFASQILHKRPPEFTIEQLGYSSVDEMLDKEDIMDVFSALRFTETDEWMHKTFDDAYSKFTFNDFEERAIEIRVLGERYSEVSKKFVAKKHHNVSHLKEFGVIFINPIAQTDKGKFIRDFALLLHYTHEIIFYSRLFKQNSESDDFNARFLSLLRGDVPTDEEVNQNDWLVIQRYLWKNDPQDKRLFTPRVNPEAMHWMKAYNDLVRSMNFSFWENTNYLAHYFGDTLVSFNLEDTAMGFVAYSAGEDARFTYHQQEALWNKLFSLYVGGYDKMEEYILKNMSKSKISF